MDCVRQIAPPMKVATHVEPALRKLAIAYVNVHVEDTGKATTASESFGSMKQARTTMSLPTWKLLPQN